eukprot:Seg6752.2 transcript_id=Seg6752.2/GoldUCD/mRNA.D3Y31 product="hypothetical protein" protein_id=Seg6752.2/GoldUCD/D3Y31
MNGWPEVKEHVANEVRPYFNIRENITFSRGLLLKGEQLIVPSSMRKEMRALIHQGHLGIEKCKIHARKSNGQVERTIQTVKRTLKKAMHSNEDLNLALLALRTTPVKNSAVSPVFLLMNRNPRTTLPTLVGNKKMKFYSRDMRKNVAGKYNSRAKDLPVLKPGQTVRLHDGKDWSRKAKIIDNHENDISYVLETEKGTTVRRNRKHMMPMKEKFECSPPEDLIFDIPETENNAIEENGTTESNIIEDDTEREQTTVNIKTRSGRTVKRPERFKDYV